MQLAPPSSLEAYDRVKRTPGVEYRLLTHCWVAWYGHSDAHTFPRPDTMIFKVCHTEVVLGRGWLFSLGFNSSTIWNIEEKFLCNTD